MRILIVEDEWLIAEDHAARLRSAGHRVVGPVPSVQAALDRIAQEEIDAALLDIQLNGETSYRVAESLQEKSIPFAFVTGHVTSEIPARFATASVLQKPVAAEGLSAAVAALAGERLEPEGE
ncbi:response regulator [Mesorhizobium neociceri]|uniref:response regulator n=1 Tax=Mesorhizobium neociceri TaxID=1307853 RepID=UPI001F315561|nr:response regulator [Mesorhizobium neociceri]